MTEMLRLLRLFRPYWGWMAISALIALASVLANVGLLAISGWFISAMAIAGVAGVSMNYFTPAALIRACAIIRTGGRYAERVISHEATFRLLAILRGWVYERLEPLAPAGLQDIHSGDLLARISGDIERLELFFLRLFGARVVRLVHPDRFLVVVDGEVGRDAQRQADALAGPAPATEEIDDPHRDTSAPSTTRHSLLSSAFRHTRAR